MRLWEIKTIIEKVLNENNQIFLEQEAIYWWQAYEVRNFKKLSDALEILSDQSWNDVDFSQSQEIFKKYKKSSIVQMDGTEFNQLNSYISSVNRFIPLYYSILETMAEDQGEQIINIKIPEQNIQSLKSLSDFNNRLDKNFKEFAIDGQFEFKWLDRWSSWYEIAVIWVVTYRVFLACLNIANEYLKMKWEYYKTKKAELDYRAGLHNSSEFTQKWLDAYIDRRLELDVEDKIKEALEKLQVSNWKTEIELQNQLLKATTWLIKELWNWTEFHLSLNPPKYAEEIGGSIAINYTKLAEIRQSEEKTKQIESPKIATEWEKSK